MVIKLSDAGMKIIDLGKRIIEVAELAGRQLVVAGSIDLIGKGQEPVIII